MKFIKLSMIAIGFLSMIACSSEEKEGGELFDQQAILYKLEGTNRKQADFSQKTTISASADEIGLQKEEKFVVALVKENSKDVSVSMTLNPQEVEKYNKVYKTNFLPFPEENITLTSQLNIKAGSVTSDEGSVKVDISSQLKENTPYMFAVTMNSASGASILNTSKTLFYTVEVVKGLINKTVKITRDEYFELEKGKFTNTSFTLEGLIFVEKFRGTGDTGEAGISTFMGVEGQTLLRFGDSGVDPDHLQANGVDIGVKFKTKKWYHIALVVNGSKTIVYVNGEKVTEFTKSGALSGGNNFYIGRSYSDGRGIEARLSELRVWKTARSAQQIKENIYEVDKKDTDLYAYWKMNEVVNSKIMDASGNGFNLKLKGQAGKSGDQKITIFEEPSPLKID
ncbi:DUF1735 and LamG domain-containing protein [Capnocytophaga catalasegens]|nr:DUF1735 and LamG domain-containing protein [Capnocytophaga catalasegens]